MSTSLNLTGCRKVDSVSPSATPEGEFAARADRRKAHAVFFGERHFARPLVHEHPKGGGAHQDLAVLGKQLVIAREEDVHRRPGPGADDHFFVIFRHPVYLRFQAHDDPERTLVQRLVPACAQGFRVGDGRLLNGTQKHGSAQLPKHVHVIREYFF